MIANAQWPMLSDLADMDLDDEYGGSDMGVESSHCWHLIGQLDAAEDELATWFPGFARAERPELAKVRLPAGWRNAGDCRTLHQVCADEWLLLVELGTKVMGNDEEAALRAAAQIYAMKLRLASAVAWLQNLGHYTKGTFSP